MMILNRSFLFIFFILISGCELDFLAGVTKGGTGGGGSTVPDPNDVKDDPKKDSFDLNLSPSKSDNCGQVTRKLYFLDLLGEEIIFPTTRIIENSELDGASFNVRLEYHNNNEEKISLRYLDCDVPLILITEDESEILFPTQHCSVFKTKDIESGESATFDLKYKLSKPIAGYWTINPTTMIKINGSEQVCDHLKLPMKFDNHVKFWR